MLQEANLSWIILEGLDRTGKSTVAELYREQGYEVVHMSAPNKEYQKEGYSGPSYLDEILELYMQYDNVDVIFDRSPYGETVWPHVYGRKPMLSEEDYEVLREFEDNNSAQRILMIDPDAKAHWERCVANNEPLNMQQFKVASALFNKIAHKYNFLPSQLKDFDGQKNTEGKDTAPVEEKRPNDEPAVETTMPDRPIGSDDNTRQDKVSVQKEDGKSDEQCKLEKANAINSILSKRIVRQKGVTFDNLESDIKAFLQTQLSELLGNSSKAPSLSGEEVEILKLYCSRIKEKAKGTK